MSYFAPVQTLSFVPESYLLTAPYLPSHFMPQQQVVDVTNLSLELDELGQSSIINLMVDNELLIPYVDLSRYDSETKDWFWYDSSGNLPYRFNKSTNKLTNIYPSYYSGLALQSTPGFDSTNLRLSGLFKSSAGEFVNFYKYSPLLLVVNNESYLDLSDYSLFVSTDRLNKVDTTTKEYFYDFNSRVYTNQNLAGVDPSQIKLYYYKISDNTVQVKCRMASNAGSETFYTPRVNHYIVKLKGQSLRV